MNSMFKPLYKIVPEGVKDGIKIEHFTVSKEDSDRTTIRTCMYPEEYVPPGTYVKLIIDGRIMMSDTLNEQRTNYKVVQKANGNVLIAGLGLGMILVPILEKPEVTSVTVIEKAEPVVFLVGVCGTFPNRKKLTIIRSDIFEWKPPVGIKYDTIYFDVWENICGDNLLEITKLKRKFARNLNRTNPKAWMGAWEESRLRYHARRERAYERTWGHPPW